MTSVEPQKPHNLIASNYTSFEIEFEVRLSTLRNWIYARFEDDSIGWGFSGSRDSQSMVMTFICSFNWSFNQLKTHDEEAPWAIPVREIKAENPFKR